MNSSEVDLLKNLTYDDINHELHNFTAETHQFDSGHITWLLACTAVTWLMVSKIFTTKNVQIF